MLTGGDSLQEWDKGQLHPQVSLPWGQVALRRRVPPHHPARFGRHSPVTSCQSIPQAGSAREASGP